MDSVTALLADEIAYKQAKEQSTAEAARFDSLVDECTTTDQLLTIIAELTL